MDPPPPSPVFVKLLVFAAELNGTVKRPDSVFKALMCKAWKSEAFCEHRMEDFLVCCGESFRIKRPLVFRSESQGLVKQDQFVSARNLDIIMGLCMASPHGIN